jgi:hypothetical protein
VCDGTVLTWRLYGRQHCTLQLHCSLALQSVSEWAQIIVDLQCSSLRGCCPNKLLSAAVRQVLQCLCSSLLDFSWSVFPCFLDDQCILFDVVGWGESQREAICRCFPKAIVQLKRYRWLVIRLLSITIWRSVVFNIFTQYL